MGLGAVSVEMWLSCEGVTSGRVWREGRRDPFPKTLRGSCKRTCLCMA